MRVLQHQPHTKCKSKSANELSTTFIWLFITAPLVELVGLGALEVVDDGVDFRPLSEELLSGMLAMLLVGVEVTVTVETSCEDAFGTLDEVNVTSEAEEDD